MSGEVWRAYGCLAIERTNGDLVEYPDGAEEIVAEGFGERKVAEYNAAVARVLPEGPPEDPEPAVQSYEHRFREWERRRDAWAKRCTIERLERPARPGAPAVFVDRVTFPDGDVEEFATGTRIRGIDHRFELVEPRPTKPQAESTATTATTQETPAAAWRSILTWQAELFLPSGRRHVKVAVPYWQFGFPIVEVLAVLNDLAQEGWRVEHVSEDRGLYSSRIVDTHSSVTRARYLLARDQT